MMLAAAGLQAGATAYYVAPTGNDKTGNGSAGNPWATIDHADSQNLMVPGDTVTACLSPPFSPSAISLNFFLLGFPKKCKSEQMVKGR